MRRIALIGICALVFVAAPLAQGAILYSTDFEGFSLGALSGQGGWTQQNGTAAAFQVENTFANAGSQALQMIPNGQPNFTRAIHSLSAAGYTGVTLSVDMYIAATGTVSNWRLTAFNTLGGTIADAIVNGTTPVLLGATQANGPALARGTWNEIALAINLNTQVARMYVNGQLTGTSGFANSSTEVSNFALALVPNSSGTASYFVDNVVVEGVPEPSTMVLLGAGLAAAGVLRRLRAR